MNHVPVWKRCLSHIRNAVCDNKKGKGFPSDARRMDRISAWVNMQEMDSRFVHLLVRMGNEERRPTDLHS